MHVLQHMHANVLSLLMHANVLRIAYHTPLATQHHQLSHALGQNVNETRVLRFRLGIQYFSL